ncbi:MAG: AMP-binding protein, partial [Promethearchaeia archaeon]
YIGGIISMLMNQPPSELDRKHSVKFAVGGEAPREYWEAFEKRFGIPIYEGWSQSEAVGFTINKVGSKGGKIGSIGKSIPGFELKIVDENGNELPPGPDNVGEILARTTLPLTLEYYKAKNEVKRKVENGRWTHTGDYGYKDKDGFVYFVGRGKDMIRRRGENISAHEIEKVANKHPSILESAAFAVPNEELQDEEVKICAIVKPGAKITHKEFYDYLNQNMAYFMVPRYIEFKDELPKTATERVKKYLLKEEWVKEKTKRNTWDAKIKDFILKD